MDLHVIERTVASSLSELKEKMRIIAPSGRLQSGDAEVPLGFVCLDFDLFLSNV